MTEKTNIDDRISNLVSHLHRSASNRFIKSNENKQRTIVENVSLVVEDQNL